MNSKPSAYSAPIPSPEPRSRRHRSADERRQWVEMYGRSGQTLKAFCSENGLAPSTLLLWRRQFLERASDISGSRLVEVALSPPGTSGSTLSVHLPRGVRLEIAPDADALWLAKCLRALCWTD